jgi:hypothetical protein
MTVYCAGSALKNSSTSCIASSRACVVFMPQGLLLWGLLKVALCSSSLAATKFDFVTSAAAAHAKQQQQRQQQQYMYTVQPLQDRTETPCLLLRSGTHTATARNRLAAQRIRLQLPAQLPPLHPAAAHAATIASPHCVLP